MDVINPDFILLFNTKLNAIQIENVMGITTNIGRIISSADTFTAF